MSIRSNSFLSLLVVSALLLSSNCAFAQAAPAEDDGPTEIQDNTPDVNEPEYVVKETVVDDDELPSESVIPITDNNSSVLNKRVTFSKRFQLDLGTGSVLDEPLLNANYLTGRISYYTSEEYSFGLGGRSRFGGKTTYAEQLEQGSTPALVFDRAPVPTESYFVSFGYNFYYGKLSLGKNMVIPASTKLDTDFGMQTFGSSSKPFLQSAITQSFFLNKYISVGLSVGLSLAQISDPTSVNIRSTQPVPAESAFSTKMQTNQYLSVNLSTIF